jgi:hypothetical protein
MTEHGYATYRRDNNHLVGVSKNKGLADAVVNVIGKALGFELRVEPVSHEDYIRLREEQERELVGNFPQDILNRKGNEIK